MEGIYRKVYVKKHSDEKYRRLSPPPPCGRSLFDYLIDGPFSTTIPGLTLSGEAAMAEALEWPIIGFRKAMDEILREGMAEVDWHNRIVWLPKGIKYNPPKAPNNVKAWKSTWCLISECPMKTTIMTQLGTFLSGMSAGHQLAFAQVTGYKADIRPEPSPESSAPAKPAGPVTTCKSTHDLAWLFRTRLRRQPNSKESQDDIAAMFEDLRALGWTVPQLEHAIRTNTQLTEPIWDFVKRLKKTRPTGPKAPVDEAEADREMQAEIEECKRQEEEARRELEEDRQRRIATWGHLKNGGAGQPATSGGPGSGEGAAGGAAQG